MMTFKICFVVYHIIIVITATTTVMMNRVGLLNEYIEINTGITAEWYWQFHSKSICVCHILQPKKSGIYTPELQKEHILH